MQEIPGVAVWGIISRVVPIGLTPNDPMGGLGGTARAPLPMISSVLRSQPDRQNGRYVYLRSLGVRGRFSGWELDAMAGLTGLPRRSPKALQVPLPRKKKVQEPQAAPLERLPDAQKDQIVSHAVLRRHAADGTAKRHELFDRVLSSVVVPGHAVVVQKGKKLGVALHDPLAVFLGNLGPIFATDQVIQEPGDRPFVFPKMLALETVFVDRRDDGLENAGERLDEVPKFGVELVPKEIVVHVADQVHEALLLRARHRLVGGVEVRDENASKPFEHTPEDRSIAAAGVDERDVILCGEDPHVARRPDDVGLGLVDVNHRGKGNASENPPIRLSVELGELVLLDLHLLPMNVDAKGFTECVDDRPRRLLLRDGLV